MEVKKLLLILILIVFSSCSHSIYWHSKEKTYTGTYTYFKPGWGYRKVCNTYSTQLPVKEKNYRRYNYWRK